MAMLAFIHGNTIPNARLKSSGLVTTAATLRARASSEKLTENRVHAARPDETQPVQKNLMPAKRMHADIQTRTPQKLVWLNATDVHNRGSPYHRATIN